MFFFSFFKQKVVNEILFKNAKTKNIRKKTEINTKIYIYRKQIRFIAIIRKIMKKRIQQIMK